MLHRLLPSSRLNPRGDGAHAKALCATPVTYVRSGSIAVTLPCPRYVAVS